jgi:hypothetical protein
MIPAVTIFARMRARRSLWWLVVPAMLASCGSEPLACTEIGCTSGVSVTVEGFQLTAEDGVDVRACLDSVCRSRTVTEEPAVVPLEVDRSASETTVMVTVQVSRDGNILMDARKKVTLHKISPNGDQCGPICYVSFVVVNPSGLHQA